jgi:RNA recognition motif-containing protein
MDDKEPKSTSSEERGKGASTRQFAVYVSDIARGTTDEQLKQAFERCAPVRDAFVVRNKYTGETKGYGFVCFQSMEDVYKCLDWDSLPRFKDAKTGRMQVVKITLADPKNTLHIGNIPKTATPAEIKKHIIQVGKEELEDFELCVDAEGKSKGYGWAKYADHDVALRAMKNLKLATFQDKVLFISFAEPRVIDQRLIENVKSLFVKNVAANVTEEQLKALFGESCTKVVIPLDRKRKVPLGHAFVHFTTREEAQSAMTRLNGTELEGRRLAIEWCLPMEAKPKKRRTPLTFSPPYPPPYAPPGPAYGRYTPPTPNYNYAYTPPPPPPPPPRGPRPPLYPAHHHHNPRATYPHSPGASSHYSHYEATYWPSIYSRGDKDPHRG